MSGRRIRTLIWKEFTQLRRDPLLLRLLMIMPIVQLILFGYVVAADVRNLATAVVDLDRTATSRELVDAFRGSGYFTIVENPTSETALQPLLDTGVVKVGVVIPEGTQDRLLSGQVADIGIVVDGSDSQVSSVASGYATQIVARENLDRPARLGVSTVGPGIDARVRVVFNPTLDPINSMIPGLIAAILLISLSAIMSQAVVKERESGTLEQLFVTPIRPPEYIIGTVTPYAVRAIAQMTIIAAVGMLWFRVPFYGDVWVVGLGLGLFLLVCIGQGLLVSLMARTRAQAIQTTLFLMLPMIVLSGFIFPIASMPAVIQPLTYLIPLRYALDVLRASFIKGSGLADLALPLLALAGFAVVIFGSAVLATRRRITE
ncbi:MAG: ABC transporter permease [Propionicimonas sp.]